MEDFKTLQLLDKIQFLFKKIGVDYSVMRQILQVKLLMDERKTPTFYTQSAKKDQDQKFGYIKSLWIYVLLGLILIPFIIIENNYLFGMSMAYGIIIFMIMTTLISEFSSVLLDVRDRTILLTKPISTKTVNAARVMHVLIYLTYLTIAITGIPLIVAFIKQGLFFGIITIVEIWLINIFVVVLTALFYIVILRFFDGEKLKDLINYVQIGLSLALMVGYQFLVRSFELVDLNNFAFDFEWWSIFLFPMWFAAPYELLLNGNKSGLTIFFSMLSVVVPFISIWLYIKLIPTFERNLEKLLSTSKSKKEKKNRLKDFLLSLICSTNEERAFYRFASLMMKQEREFKLKVYPSLGFGLVLPFIFLFNNINQESDYSVSTWYLTIYFSLLIIPTSVFMLSHASNYKAAWIYQIFPLKDFTNLKKASLKAFLIKLFLPIYIILSVIFCFIYGVRIIPDLLAILVASWLYSVICYIGFGNRMPFSKPFNDIGDSQGWKMLVLLLPVAILAYVHHYMVSNFTYGALIYLFSLVVINFITWKAVFHRRLNKV